MNDSNELPAEPIPEGQVPPPPPTKRAEDMKSEPLPTLPPQRGIKILNSQKV